MRRASVSSSPDDGTLRLYRLAPRRIVPFLRPYRRPRDRSSWYSNPAIREYMDGRLSRRTRYGGFGEFHLSEDNVDGPVVRHLAALAARRRLFFHAHVDGATVEKLLTLYPQVRILWAHAGLVTPIEEVEKLLSRFANLWVELAVRLDIAPGGILDSEWRDLFLQHSVRFLIGTDTWRTERWGELVEVMRTKRHWLRQMPLKVAEQIAYKNGDRLFKAP